MSTVDEKPAGTRPKPAKPPKRRRKLTAAERAERAELKARREKQALEKLGKHYEWNMTASQGRRVAAVMLLVVLISPLYSLLFDRPQFDFHNAAGQPAVAQQEILIRPFKAQPRGPSGQSLPLPGIGGGSDTIRQLQKTTGDSVLQGRDGLTWLLFEVGDGRGQKLWYYVTDDGSPGPIVRGQRDPERVIRPVVVSYPTLFHGGEPLYEKSRSDWVKVTASLVARHDYEESPQRLSYLAPSGTFMMLGWQDEGGTGADIVRNARRTMVFAFAGPAHTLMGVGFLTLAALVFGRFLGARHPLIAVFMVKTLPWHERMFFGTICLTGFSFLAWQGFRHLALVI